MSYVFNCMVLSDVYHNQLVFAVVVYVFPFSNYYFVLYNPGRNESTDYK